MKVEQSIIDTLREAATGIRDEQRVAANTASRIGTMFLDIIAALGLVDTREAGVSNWEDLLDKPTTLAGYGILDAFTKDETLERFLTAEVLDDLFTKVPILTHEAEDGTVVVDRYAIRANYTLFSVGDVAAFGREDGIETGGGTGSGTGSGVSSWADLLDKPTTLQGFGILQEVKDMIPSFDGVSIVPRTLSDGKVVYGMANGFATQEWVMNRGFLTEHQSLEGYATESWVTKQNYIDSNYVKLGVIKNNDDQDLLGVITVGENEFVAVGLGVISEFSEQMEPLQAHIEDTSLHIQSGERDKWNSKQDAISDLDTIRSNAENGNEAHVWGNHALAGYYVGTADTIKAIKVNNAGHADTADTATTAGTLANGITLWGISGINAGSKITSAPNLYIGTTKVQASSAQQNLIGIGNLDMSGVLTIGSAKLTYDSSKHILAFTDANDNPLHLTATGDVVAYSGLDVESLGLTVGMLKDVAISSSLANGQALVWNGSKWVNQTIQQGGLTEVNWSDVKGRPTVVSAFTNDAGYITSAALNDYQPLITDIATIRSNADKGAIAYGWDNHANAGYLTKSTADSYYLGKTAKAADSAKFNGKDDKAFVHTSGYEEIDGEKTFHGRVNFDQYVYVGSSSNVNDIGYCALIKDKNEQLQTVDLVSANRDSLYFNYLQRDTFKTVYYGKEIIFRAKDYVNFYSVDPSGNATHATILNNGRNVIDEDGNNNLLLGFGYTGIGETRINGKGISFWIRGNNSSVEISNTGALRIKEGVKPFYVLPENSTDEGGQITFKGATSAYADKHIDLYQDTIRFFVNGKTPLLTLDWGEDNPKGLLLSNGEGGKSVRLWYDSTNDCLRTNKTIVSEGDVVAFGSIGAIESPTLESLTVKKLIGGNNGDLYVNGNHTWFDEDGMLTFQGEDNGLSVISGAKLSVTNNGTVNVVSSGSIRINDGGQLVVGGGDSDSPGTIKIGSGGAISSVSVDKNYTQGSSGYYFHITIGGERYRVSCYKEN